MREQVRSHQTLVGIGESVRWNAVIAALMMFLTQAHDVVAQSQQEVVFAVMMRLVNCLRFLDEEVFVVVNYCGRYIQGGITIGS